MGGFCSVLCDPGWGSPEDLEEKVTTQSHIRRSSYLQPFTGGRKAQSLPFKLLGLRRELIFTLAYRPVCSSRGMLICLRTVRPAGGKTHFTLRVQSGGGTACKRRHSTPACGSFTLKDADTNKHQRAHLELKQISCSQNAPWSFWFWITESNWLIQRESRACSKTKQPFRICRTAPFERRRQPQIQPTSWLHACGK